MNTTDPPAHRFRLLPSGDSPVTDDDDALTDDTDTLNALAESKLTAQLTLWWLSYLELYAPEPLESREEQRWPLSHLLERLVELRALEATWSALTAPRPRPKFLTRFAGGAIVRAATGLLAIDAAKALGIFPHAKFAQTRELDFEADPLTGKDLALPAHRVNYMLFCDRFASGSPGLADSFNLEPHWLNRPLTRQEMETLDARFPVNLSVDL
jgi:hypothetical protein